MKPTFFLAILSMSFIAIVAASNTKASDDLNSTIEEASLIYEEAQTLEGRDRINKLEEVQELLVQIESDHSDEILADDIKQGRRVGGIDVADLREELAQASSEDLFDFEETSEALENAHKRLLAVRTLKERFEIAKDFAVLLAKFNTVEKLSRLTAQNSYFALKLRDAKIDYNTAGFQVVAGLFVDKFIEEPLRDALSSYMADNLAASTASTLATMAEAIVSGGAVLPGFVFEQTALIVEASISLRETNSALVDQVYSGTKSSVENMVRGDLSFASAMEQFNLTKKLAEDYVGLLAFSSSRDASNKMWIISQLARLKVQEGPETLPANSLLETLPTQLRILDMDSGATLPGQFDQAEYKSLADKVARSFNLRTWPFEWTEAKRQDSIGGKSSSFWNTQSAAALGGRPEAGGVDPGSENLQPAADMSAEEEMQNHSPEPDASSYEAEESSEEKANRLFVSAVRQALLAATMGEREREQVYADVAATFDRIVSEFPDSRQAISISAQNVPGIDFSLLNLSQKNSLESVVSLDFPDGLYAIDPSLCTVSDTVGDAWGTLFQSISESNVQRGSERECIVSSVSVEADIVSITAECSVEGEQEEESWKWQKNSTSSFEEIEGQNAGRAYVLCSPFENLDERQTQLGAFDLASSDINEPQASATGGRDPTEPFSTVSSTSAEESIQFVFPKEELDRVMALSNDGELRSTGFNVEISNKLSVNCTHWITQGAGAASEFGITTWQALLPKLQCNVWSKNDDGSSVLVPNTEVSAALSNDGALIMKLADAAYFQNARKDSPGPCAFSIQNQVFDYKKDWSAECLGPTTTPTRTVEFTALIDGLYGRSSENCSIDRSSVAENPYHSIWIGKPEISVAYESSCTVLRASSENQTTVLTASCHAEGEYSENLSSFRWQILSASTFIDLDAPDGPTEFRLCEKENTTSGDLDEWTSAAVHTGGYGRGELTACLFNSGSRYSTAECLRNDGASEETIRFAEARATEGGEGPEVPVDFRELGKVDIVFLDSFTMSQNEWEYFVNTSPETISAPMYPERDLRLLASRGDRRAQVIIRQFPGATAWKPFVGGMRVLPNGHQRFSTVVYWTENCRACPIVGYNLATVDFDQAGRFRAYETRGVFDNRKHAKFMGMTADDLRQNDAAVQLYLNLRGYDAGPMDGALGPRTRAALSDFQRENNVSNGLGIPDQATLEALVNRETLFANGSGNALNLNGEHDTNEAVGLMAGNNLGSCVPVGNPRFPERLLPEEDSSTHRGRTVNGDNWTVKLGSPGLRDGPSEFTNSAGVTVDGFWRTSNSGICQSYNERQSWVCHDIFACDGEENLFAMRNANGEFTSVIEGRVNGTTGFEVDASDIFGVLDSDPHTNEDRVASLERGIQGKFESPWEYMEWVQVASRLSLNEAREVSRQFMSEFPKTQIFKASNGWYAVVVDYIDDHFDNDKRLAELVGSGQVPRDTILTTGSNFTERFSAAANTPLPTPEFVYATVVRDTRIGGETQADGSRYEGQEVTRAGTEVAVSGRYNNDCNLSRHGLAIVPCSDLSGIDNLPDSASVVSTGASNGDESRQVSDQEETPAALYARINGDDLADKLIAATTWGNSSVERELLQDLAKVSGADFRRLGDLEKLSRLTAILGMIEERAGVPVGSIELLNRARNARSGQHPTREEVLRDNHWSLNEKKDFHVIDIADPSRVEKYIRSDGAEAVFYNASGGGWKVLADGVNDATYNFVPDVPLLSSGYVNDNYQHLVLDIIPWVIWGATARDTTSISQRLALFENSTQYKHLAQKLLPLLAGQLPDGDPITTNDESPQLDIRTAKASELVALLRSFGVLEGNASVVSGDIAAQEQEISRLISDYRDAPPLITTPLLPVSGSYDEATQSLSICTREIVRFPTDLVKSGGNHATGFMIVPSDPITSFGSLPRLCVVDVSEIKKVEALHGTSEFDRFSLSHGSGLFLRLAMNTKDAKTFEAAIATGQARLEVRCEMESRVHEPTPWRYNHKFFGTCIPNSVKLLAINFETGDQEFMQFSAGGTVFQPTSGVVKSTTPPPVPDPAATADTQTRAMWSFKVDGTGEAAVRDLVEGLDGTVAEIVIGYENAYPFKTAPAKKLAVRIFQALPENEVATRAGTERGYGSFVIKSWSDLNNFYFIDDPSSGLANAIVGTIEEVRILSVRQIAASSCEWSVTYRIWLRNMTPFGTALAASTESDGFTFEACFRTTREGYDVESYRYVDPI